MLKNFTLLLLLLPLLAFGQYEGHYLGLTGGAVIPDRDLKGFFNPGVESGLSYERKLATDAFGVRTTYLRLKPKSATRSNNELKFDPLEGFALQLYYQFHLFSDHGYRKVYPILGLDLGYQYLAYAGANLTTGKAFETFHRFAGGASAGVQYHVADPLLLKAHFQTLYSFGGDQNTPNRTVSVESTFRLYGIFLTAMYRLSKKE